VILERPGCFLPLAAEPLSAARSAAVAFEPTWATSPSKTRARNLRPPPSGRLSRRRRFRSMFTPGSRACAYRTASGRAKWPNRDPLGDLGFDMRNQLLSFTGNQANRRPYSQTYVIIEQWEGANLYGFVYNNPVLWVDAYGLYTLGECADICGAFFSGAAQGLAAEIDGALPFVDPFASGGAYDPNDPNLKASQTCGAIASCALGGAGALRGGAALGGRAGSVLNHNRYIRIGPGNIPKGKPFTCGPGQKVPTLRIGNGPPTWYNHWDLRIGGY